MIIFFSLSGRPVFIPNLNCLTTLCLKERKDILNEELEPFDVTNLLFEEYALTFDSHNKITMANQRRNQTRHLLETIEENGANCFYVFLDILYRKEEYKYICNQLESPINGSVENDIFDKTKVFVKHEIIKDTGTIFTV